MRAKRRAGKVPKVGRGEDENKKRGKEKVEGRTKNR